jgi:hypothetical protein
MEKIFIAGFVVRLVFMHGELHRRNTGVNYLILLNVDTGCRFLYLILRYGLVASKASKALRVPDCIHTTKKTSMANRIFASSTSPTQVVNIYE